MIDQLLSEISKLETELVQRCKLMSDKEFKTKMSLMRFLTYQLNSNNKFMVKNGEHRLNDEYLTQAEFSIYRNIHPQNVHNYIETRKLDFVEYNGRKYIHRDETIKTF